MDFKILGKVRDIETIAVGNSIRGIDKLKKRHGKGRWRKLKGIAWIQMPGQAPCWAEIHWYEAHGVGKLDYKIKDILTGAGI